MIKYCNSPITRPPQRTSKLQKKPSSLPDPDYESGSTDLIESGFETLGRITSARVVQDPVSGRPVQSLEFLLLVKSCHSMKDFMHMTKKLLDDLSQVQS